MSTQVLRVVVMLYLFGAVAVQAQEIEAKLSGNTSSQGFTVRNFAGSELLTVRGDGKVGIGVLAPEALLHVNGFTKLTGRDGFLVQAPYPSNTGATIAPSGEGIRMFFYPKKQGAFRVGGVWNASVDRSAAWNEANIGNLSFASGWGTIASGLNSTAMGAATTASGMESVAIGTLSTASGSNAIALGRESMASGTNSIALGRSVTASGLNAIAMGESTTASGAVSTAIGFNTSAAAYGSVALGRYNVGGGTPGSWDAADPVFEIGIGASGTSKANAVTVLKNGRVGIGTATPGALLDVTSTGGVALEIDQDGTGNAAYFHIDNTSSTQNCLRAVTLSTNVNSDALEVVATAGNALEASSAGTAPTIWAYSTNTATSTKIISAGTSSSYGSEVFGVQRNGNLTITGQAYKPGGGSWASSSDLRLKHLDGAYERGLSDILRLRTVRFHYRDGNARNLPTETSEIGFVAQEVRAVMPECVTEGDDGYLDFNMHPVNVALVNAVQQLAREKDAEIATLRGELDTLRDELRALRQIVAASARGTNPDASQAALEVR
jgi:hypothetical protein